MQSFPCRLVDIFFEMFIRFGKRHCNKPPNVHKKRFFLGGDSETRIYLKKI